MLKQTGIQSPEYRYHLLRVASERFKTDPAGLDQTRLAEAHRQARVSFELETLVLDSPEAQGVAIPPQQVESALALVRARYPDEDSFASDLARNELTPEILASALRRELAFDAVMQRVGACAEPVVELDERLFYELHLDRFTQPERRTVRHILITINDDFAENCRGAARERIERLAERLRETRGGTREGLVHRFAALARKHSECPTALEDGRLGDAVRGQLYPEIDALLFRLEEGEIGGPVQSEIGFHLVLCERIHAARRLPFGKVRPQIQALIEERRRRACQKDWIAELKARAAEPAGGKDSVVSASM